MDVKGQWAAVTLIAALLFLLLSARYARRDHVSGDPSPEPVIVEVRGDVRDPGAHLIERPFATVADALEAAGSQVRSASSVTHDSLLHRPIHTGESIRASLQPGGGLSVEIGQMNAAARLTLGIRLDLNAATVEELRLVPEMKPQVASAIVEHRERKPWRSVDELVEIPGVGPKTAERFKNYLEVLPTGLKP
jgi:competence protein ComEA